MPIRMVDDPQDQQDNGNDSGGGQSNFPGGEAEVVVYLPYCLYCWGFSGVRVFCFC